MAGHRTTYADICACLAIHRLRNAGVSVVEIARQAKHSRGWVYRRLRETQGLRRATASKGARG